MIDKYPPGTYRQHILAGLLITGPQPVTVNTHGGGTGAEGSFITATFGQQLMITLYDLAAVATYTQAWTSTIDLREQFPLRYPTGRQWPGPVTPGRAACLASRWRVRFAAPSPWHGHRRESAPPTCRRSRREGERPRPDHD